MSGKNLPEQCAKAGPAYCAWQFPNVSMTSATDAKTYAERWSVNPGFLDPFHLVYQCVKRLKGGTFVNVKYSGPKKVTDKSQLCPGLRVYFGEIVQNAKVNGDVKDYISVGSTENVTALIRNYPSLQYVLLFLLKYLKARGPLIKFKYNSREMLNSIVANPRFLVTNFMNTLCEFELEFQAAVTIGDYLNYLLFVAFSHDLFWMKELLADIWGPLLVDFINVGSNGSDTLKEFEKRDRLKLITLRMLENVPWERLKSVENLKITINPQINDSYLKRKAAEAASELHRLTTMPIGTVTILTATDGSMSNNIGALLGELNDVVVKAEENNVDPSSIAQNEAAEAERKRQADEASRKKSTEAENRDFSSEYGYSSDFLDKYAPHGMCKPGFDPTYRP